MPVWNVYTYNINSRKIETFNIFKHGRFYESVKEDLQLYSNKSEFAERLKANLTYYFWSKSEWEILISPWIGGNREKESIKVDVFLQVNNNFNILLDYIWNNKNEILKEC